MSRSDTAGFKRKVTGRTNGSRKKAKVVHHSIDTLPWKTISRPRETGMAGDDGILELEEIDGVEVIYEEKDHGRIATFKVSVMLTIDFVILD